MFRLRTALAAAIASAVAATSIAAAPAGSAVSSPEIDDAVVVAIIDNGFAPYHDDFNAIHMPQHLDRNPANDLPLDRDPAEWLPGFDRSAFASFEPLPLTIPGPFDSEMMESSYVQDSDVWASAQQSVEGEVHGSWVPGTKIIAGISFDTPHFAAPSGAAHGTGTSSVSVGNNHGTCPECLVVLIRFSDRDSGEAALDWAFSQSWIDVVSNSFGYSTAFRDQVYDGSNTFLQSEAVLRGQGIVWSAGNGQANAFVVPAPTLLSSQKGGDWTITVGAISPSGNSYTGHNKPVDIAAPGTSYPSAPSSGANQRTDSEDTFSGTSNAAPVIAGTYARALYEARRALQGPSRIQADGVIATGEAVSCGAVRPGCELGDGILTGLELRTRLLHGAVHTPGGYGGPVGAAGTPYITAEHEFLNEGHGSYFGTLGDRDEEHLRILEPMLGLQQALERPAGEREWMIVDSFCRQRLWGTWDEGYWHAGDPLPGPDPAWPMRQAYLDSCDQMPEDRP